MIAHFSPFTRRVLAIGILVLGLLGLVNLVLLPLYGVTARSLSGLEDARFERDRLEAIAARPPVPRSEPVPDSLYLTAPNRQQANDALLAALGRSASGYEVQLDTVAPMPEDQARGKAIAVSLQARGEQDKILSWLNDLETGSPAVHFTEWSIAPEGEAAAVPAPAPTAADPEGAPPAAPPSPGSGPVRLAFNGIAIAVWEQKP
jgi:hypothetical protein